MVTGLRCEDYDEHVTVQPSVLGSTLAQSSASQAPCSLQKSRNETKTSVLKSTDFHRW